MKFRHPKSADMPQKAGLIVLKPDGKAYSEVTRYKVADTLTYAHPVVTGNRIFVRDQDSVTLWTIQ
jgi:hypothetical protein